MSKRGKFIDCSEGAGLNEAMADLFESGLAGVGAAQPPPGAKATTGNPALDVTLLALREGFSPLVPREDGSKAPLADIPIMENGKTRWSWEGYQTTPATEKHIRKAWFKGDRRSSGLICGYGGLECLEWDDRATFDAYLEAAEAAGLGDLVERVRAGYEETTPGGGIHWLYRVDTPGQCTKLAQRPDPTPENPHKIKTLIETKSEGGFIIIAPSNGKVHPSGGKYELRSGGLEFMVRLTAEERDELWNLARSFDEHQEERVGQGPDKRADTKHATGDGKRPGDDLEDQMEWADILEPHGWERVHRRGDVEYWRRPGKDQGISATTGHCKGLKVFTTSTTFDTKGTYTKLGAYTALNHAGDWTRSIKALVDLGFGTWIDSDGTERQNPPPKNWRRATVGSGKPSSNGVVGAHPAATSAVFSNYALHSIQSEDGRQEERKKSLLMHEIAGTLDYLSPGWPKRVEETLFIRTIEHEPIYLNSSARLFAWVDTFAKVDWTKGGSYITQERFYEHKRMTADRFDAIETLPHWPPLPDIYYMHQEVPRPSGLLETLVDFYNPVDRLDRELIKAMILTVFWGGDPGDRPAFLITGADDDQEQGRGLGKTTLAETVAEELAGGYVDVSPTDAISDVKTRLLSTEEGRKRVVRLDNVKTLKFSWADLEGLITSSEISGRALYKGEGRRPNTLVWFITLNGASLSKDMAQRCIQIKLARPTFKPSWESDLRTFIRENRWGLLADIKERLEAPSYLTEAKTRWAPWERDVLAKVKEWKTLQTVIRARQTAVDDDDDEREHIAEFFEAELKRRGHVPDVETVLIPSVVAAEWVSDATRTNYPTNRASAFLRGLSIPTLRKSDRGSGRGWVWTGKKTEDKEARKLGDLHPWETRTTGGRR